MPYLWADRIYFRLEQLRVAYPNLCTVGNLFFKTTENVLGKYIRICKTPVVDGASILITAGIHAREWAPPDAVLSLAEVLLQAAKNNTAINEGGYTLPAAAVQGIVNRVEVYIAPLINPDGRNFSQVSVANMRWRKNRRQIRMRNPATGQFYRDPSGGFPYGVDINRNFDIEWDFEEYFKPGSGVRSSKDPRDREVFIGDRGAASERETQNVVRLLTGKRITHYFDVHANAKVVLYSWGIESNQSADARKSFLNQQNPPAGWKKARDGVAAGANTYEEFIPQVQETELKRVAGVMSAAIATATGAVYPVEQASKLYVTTGASDDFAYSRDIQTMHAFTLELGGRNFWPDYLTEFPALEKECHAALLSAIADASNRPRPSPGGAAGLGGPGSAGTSVPSAPPPGGGGSGAGSGSGGSGSSGTGGGAMPSTPATVPDQAAPKMGHECRVNASGHCSRFLVKDQDGLREQLLFAASHPGVAASPVGQDRILAYKTIINEGPRAVRVYWDGPPPAYEVPDQSVLLMPGNSVTVAAGRALKVVYSNVPAGLAGDYAQGFDVVSWCCPKPWHGRRK